MDFEKEKIPYIVWESDKARVERTIARLIHIIALLIVGLIVSNGLWLCQFSKYDFEQETTTTTITQDTEESGTNNFIGDDGDINNGTADNNNQENSTQNDKTEKNF